ncbi:tRNA dihydrouridine synthase [Uliginosibacterium flavum]|uniref:tRNA-dihydrouridine(16) synthase n=1 Tax=Uliginosibacterium flavum TaxID=1396831 RepID=A0ABV2TS13_9RHOO
MPCLLLAPMEGLVDAVMRDVLTRASSYDWCVTEFVRISNSVLPAKVYTRVAPELLSASRTAVGTSVRVQLLGSDPELMGICAADLAALQPAGIDLNFGCPAPTVNRHRGGAVLLEEPELLHRIAQAVRTSISGRMPLSAKMRLGVSDTHRAIEAAQALADGGAELLVVHARTKDDGYRPPAHWPWIARIAEAVKIPVVANGEIWTVADYQRCVSESGCNQLMLGRGAVADPFLAERIRTFDAGGEPTTAEGDWARLLPLLGDFWQGVLHKVEPHHAPGRIKQWLNLLRRTFPQAELLYQRVRPLRSVSEVSAELLAAGAL